MRRALLFLLLFGVGLAVLLLVRGARERPEVERPPPPGEAPKEEQFTELPVGAEDASVGVALLGRVELRDLAAGSERRMSLVAGESEPLGGDRYEFRDLSVEVRERASDELVASIAAPSSRVSVTLVGGRPEIGAQDEVELFDAEITLHRGAPIVPLTVRVPRLAWRIESGELSSQDRVVISGAGLEARGTGLTAIAGGALGVAGIGAGQSLRLASEGVIEIELPRGATATLSSTAGGPITFGRSADGEVTLSAEGGAHLSVDLPADARPIGRGEPEHSEIDAREIRLRAAPQPGGRLELVGATAAGDVRARSAGVSFRSDAAELALAPRGRLVAAVLDGAVELEREGDEFRSAKARFLFDETGELARAELEGEPRGDVEVGRYLSGLPDLAPAGALTSARGLIEGSGLLTIDFARQPDAAPPEGARPAAPEVAIALDGPARVRIPELGLELEAARSLRAGVDDATRTGSLAAGGAVRARYAGRALESEGLEIDWATTADGRATVDARTDGASRISGETPAGRPVTLEAREGLSVRVAEGRTTVPLARGVSVELGGGAAVRARAASLRDLDWEAQTFVAEGDVLYEDASGTARAARVESLGPLEQRLSGAEGAPATYELYPRAVELERGVPRTAVATASASEIVRRGDVLDARGDVRARAVAGEESFEIDSGRLVLGLERQAGEARALHVTASEAASARVTATEGRSSLRAREIDVAAELEPGSSLESGAALGAWSLVAAGEVHFDLEASGGLDGRAERVEIDGARRGKLEGGPAGRVHALVRYPLGGYGYTIEATRIEFSPEGLDAVDVEIRASEPLPLDAGAAPPAGGDEVAGLGAPATEDDGARSRDGEIAATSRAPGSLAPPGEATPRLVLAFPRAIEHARARDATAPAAHPRGGPREGEPAAQDPAIAPAQTGPPSAERDAPAPPQEEPRTPRLLYLRGDSFHADQGEVRLRGSALLRGATPQGEPWEVEAEEIEATGRFESGRRMSSEQLETIDARGSFRARLGDRVAASGERLHGDRERLRIDGTALKPARLEFEDLAWESAWIDYQTADMLLSTDRGRVHSVRRGGADGWSIEYESLQPFAEVRDGVQQEDTTILVLRNPVFAQGPMQVRADWLLFWVDRNEWRRSGRGAVRENLRGTELRRESAETPLTTPPTAPRFRSRDPQGEWAALRAHPLARILGEVYVSGNVEFLEGGQRRARASAIYLDVADGKGWVQDADVIVEQEIRDRLQTLRAKAAWMRVGTDLSLRARDALVTSCDYDDPHYVVETGDLELRWTPGRGTIGFSVEARDNVLRFQNSFGIPLPPLVYNEDEEGNSFVENLVAGNSSRFGTSVRATFNVTLGSLGRGIGGGFGKLLDFPKEALRGRWKFDAGYLSSRGVLLGTGLEYEVDDDAGRDLFDLDLQASAIPFDTKDDDGYVRVDTDERSTFRSWVYANGRWWVDRREWFDVAFSKQSDPGVQSEFFEREWVAYERKDTYLHWRKASGANYYNASAEVQLDERTDVSELPELGAFHERTPIGEVAGVPILWRAFADAAYLSREESDFPFDPTLPPPPGHAPFEDGLGDRDSTRFDTEQRLEAPFPVGWANVRATPWVSARGTAWGEGADPEDAPTRLGLFAGLDLSTTAWRRFANGGIHVLAPVVGVRTDLAFDQSGDLIQFDEVEDPLEGRFVEVGIRSRWRRPESRQRFDVEVRGSHGSSLPDGQEDGFQPVGVLAEFLTYLGDVPVGLTHDGRYDVEDGTTTYSRTYFGFEPHPKLGIELGYNRGLDAAGELLYESASAGTRWRATSKWEFELQQSVSLKDDERLDNEFLLRRLGHDFVLEVGVEYRAGEGTSFGIRVAPKLTFRPSRLGLIDRELGLAR